VLLYSRNGIWMVRCVPAFVTCSFAVVPRRVSVAWRGAQLKL